MVLNTSFFGTGRAARDASIAKVFKWWANLSSCADCKFKASTGKYLTSVIRYDYYDTVDGAFKKHGYRVKTRTYFEGPYGKETCAEFKYKDFSPYLAQESLVIPAKDY